MSLKDFARGIYRLIPDSGLKKRLTAAAYRALYGKQLKDCSYSMGVFKVVTPDSVEIKSCWDFDPEPFLDGLPDMGISGGNVVMDWGGNIGVVAAWLQKKVGTGGKVYAFEPDPVNLKKLEVNLGLNQAGAVQVIEQGLWEESGALEFYAGAGYTSSFLKTDYIEKQEKKLDAVRVSVTTLDDFAEKEALSRLDFIKIDIEGSEVQAIRGGKKTLSRFHPRLLIESHNVEGVNTAEQVVELLKECGYRDIRQCGDTKLPEIIARF